MKMNKLYLKKSYITFFFILSFFIFIPCLGNTLAASENGSPELSDCSIESESEFGGIYIHNTIDEFNSLGFEYGDSINISFSNGYEIKDIPYYNGYYTKNGETLLVAYPGYPYIKAAINNGDDLWKIAGVTDTDTATITLQERGKYLNIQEARNIHYTDERNDYASDTVFANFRAVQAGNIKKDTLFRGASPCDNQHSRATYANKLIKENRIDFILDLADDDEKIKGYMAEADYSSDYFKSLYEAGNVAPIRLNSNYASQEYSIKLALGLTAMLESSGPYYIHCTEGKDRTGFVCVLLEALSGASYDEIKKDYMITYDNYYGINETSDNEKYNLLADNLLDPMIQCLAEDDNADVRNVDLENCAERYLRNGGMSSENIEKLKKNLCTSKTPSIPIILTVIVLIIIIIAVLLWCYKKYGKKNTSLLTIVVLFAVLIISTPKTVLAEGIEPSSETATETTTEITTETTTEITTEITTEATTEKPKPKLTPQQKLDKGKWKIKHGHVYHYNKDGKKTKGLVTIKGKKYYFDKKGIQRTGWRKIKGNYYFFRIKNKSKGYMVKSKTINGIKIKKNGKAKLSSYDTKRKLKLMTSIAEDMDKITNCKMSRLQKMRKAYNYLIKKYEIGGSQNFYYEKNWDITYAARMYRDGHGACFEFGALYAYFANACGAKYCYAVSSGGHGWAEVNSKVFDPNWEKGTGQDYFNMDYGLSGVGGRPDYAIARMYVKRI